MPTSPLPDDIGRLRLFERPSDGETGRVVYQGPEYPAFQQTAHEYWIVEQGGGEWRVVQAIATFSRGDGFDRHIERLVGTFRSNKEAVDNIPQYLDGLVGDVVREHHDDGSIRFEPSFTKEQAGYTTVGEDGFDDSHKRCGECVHYIPGRGCHFVQGEIDPADYCTEYYADLGVFAHRHGSAAEINAEMIGAGWDWPEATIEDFVSKIERRLGDLEMGDEEWPGEWEGGDEHQTGVVEELLGLRNFEKGRRLDRPKEGDEWPGSWSVFETQFTRLPSWSNDDGDKIRVDDSARPPYGFVHIGGTAEWRGDLAEIHDEMVAYMAENP